MAITTSLSCVDYLSIKFGCQNLNSDKEIYNHLSQEWFCRPWIEEFSFDTKNDSWVNLFTDTAERGKAGGNKPRPKRRKNPTKVQAKNSKNVGFCGGNVDIIENAKDASEFPTHSEKFVVDDRKSAMFQTSRSKLFEKDVSLEDVSEENSLISSNSDDCCSESELELLQIYGNEISEDYEDSLEPIPLKLSRKRTSNECLARAEKRMRPCINITKMHQSRIACITDSEDDEDDMFIPICSERAQYL